MRRTYAAYVALGLGLWPLPLLNVLQVESAAVVSAVAFFVAGWSAVSHFRTEQSGVWRVLGQQEVALLIPLAMLTVSQLWASNCTYTQGVLFYVLFPCVTVVFAVGLAYAITGAGLSRPYLVLGAVGVLVALGGPVYDLGLHPQLYTYNHVFGGVLGPIYDEQLAVRWGLFAFRGLTLLWAGALLLLGRRFRGQGRWWGLPVCVGVIGLVYWFAAPLGINTPAAHLQEELGGHLRTTHFDLYYDPSALDRRAAEALARQHEEDYDYLRRRLDIAPGQGPERIQSYLYPNPDVKARLTGARTTSVTPVWLDQPQVHLLVDRADQSLGHELAHVFSRAYGLPLLRASWAPGLVEGWAVALEPPDPYPSAHDLVSVATTTDTVGGLSTTAHAIADRLTPWGFWTGRSAVSYAAMGSFVGHLLDTYGPAPLKRVYARGNFASVYGRSLDSLAAGWARSLRERPYVSRAAHDLVARQFTRPSLFEKDCPHYVPPHRRHLQAAQRAQRRGDSVAVDKHLRQALDAAPQYAAAHAALARRRLARGAASSVRTQLDTLGVTPQSVSLRLLLGDAFALTGEPKRARRQYRAARAQTPRYAHDTRTRLLLRLPVARRPEVVEVLVGGASPQDQAQHLAGLAADAPAIGAWRALRLQDAHRYASADSLWRRVPTTLAPDWPRAWQTAWDIQRQDWHSAAAYRAGGEEALRRARQLARSASRRAAAHGARGWAATLTARAGQAKRALDARP